MDERKSFYEIIVKKLEGKWCNGLAILDVSDEISIDNIYNNNEKQISINNYAFSICENSFYKVVEMEYQKAVIDFKTKNKNIISPKIITDEIVTFDGFKHIEYGGNVYCHTKDNQIIVNDKHYFKDIDEILGFGFISKKEIEGKWLVF